MLLRWLFSFIFLTLLLSCDQKPDPGDSEKALFSGLEKTVFLGHRGSGNQSELKENSIPAIDYGMSQLDGVEIDLQLSHDTTFWLYHDFDISNCEKQKLALCDLTDEQIEDISDCNDLELVTFDSLVQILASRNYRTKKYISLDLKCAQSYEVVQKFGGPKSISKHVNQKIQSLEEHTQGNFEVLVEIPELTYSDYLDLPADRLFLLCRDGKYCIEDAERNQTGLSLSLSNALKQVDWIEDQEIECPTQLWTPNTGTELLLASELTPDFIQSDEIELLRSCRLIIENGADRKNLSSNKSLTFSGEFRSIYRQKGQPAQSGSFLFVKYKAELDSLDEDSFIVIAKKSADGDDNWRSMPLKNGENRILEYFGTQHQKGDTTHIYFWNPKKEEVRLENFVVDYLTVR